MKLLARIVRWIRLLKRVSELEGKVGLMHPCHDCGGWLLPGHKAVGLVPNEQAQLEPRCRWCQAAYERSPLCRARARARDRAEKEAALRRTG